MTDPGIPGDRLAQPIRLGRYELHDPVASGGMATVHVGRLLGDAGFSRTVAIKRLHPQYAREPEFVTMLLDEARLASRIAHPNVVSPLDVVAIDGEVFLVMDFVKGQTLGRLMKVCISDGKLVPVPIAVRILRDMLAGLHAAHEARDAHGLPLQIVHRDVSPQNILVDVGGCSRVLDFGIAKASVRLQTTREGQMKGKLPYMAPEQLLDRAMDRRVDVYAAAVVMWEILCGRALFSATTDAAILGKILEGTVVAPSRVRAEVPSALDAIVMQGLARNPEDRFVSAEAFATALDVAIPGATHAEVAEWMKAIASPALLVQTEMISRIETSSAGFSDRLPLKASEKAAMRENATQAMPLIKKRMRWPWPAGLVVLVLGLPLVLLIRNNRQPKPIPAVSPAQVPRQSPESVPVPTAARATPTISESVHQAPSGSRVVKRTLRKSSVAHEATPVDCSVPFVIGSDGIRRVKRECLKSLSSDNRRTEIPRARE